MPIRITLDKYAGFCGGVKRSLDMAYKVTETPAYTFRHIVHNDEVVKQLQGAKCISPISDLEGITEGTLIISAHGVGPKLIEQALRQGLNVVDATCPNVKKVHQLVETLAKRGYRVTIFGDRNHSEVEGIQGWAGEDVLIIKNAQEAEEIPYGRKQMALVSQTTKNMEDFQKITSILKNRWSDIEIYDTICNSVKKQQSLLKNLAKNNEAVMIVGDRTSENTRQLCRISTRINPNTYFITDVSEFKSEWLKGLSRVGITAGASTPPLTIKELIKRLETL